MFSHPEILNQEVDPNNSGLNFSFAFLLARLVQVFYIKKFTEYFFKKYKNIILFLFKFFG